MKLSDLRNDDKRMQDGVWVRWSADGAEVLVRSTFSTAFQTKRERLEAEYRRRMAYRPDKPLSQSENIDITREAANGTILGGMRGWQNDDGTPLEFTEQVGAAFLSIASQLTRLLTIAGDEANFTREATEVREGNFEPSSDSI